MPGYTPTTDLPRWTQGPAAGGVWKSTPEDFLVEELPEVAPDGAGEHLWLRIEKVGVGTLEVVEALARTTGRPASEIGYAGMKDRDARTVQDFTVQLAREVPVLPPGMRVLASDRTRKRLRIGQLLGNRFTVRIRGGDIARARARIAELTPTGMPNYYGVQRVGGRAATDGARILRGVGPRLPFSQLKFALSAYQSVLFNRVLAFRGPGRRRGDLDIDAVPTGPMYGPTMAWPTGEALEIERGVLAEEHLPDGAWERFGKLTQGTRRKLWVPVSAEIRPETDGFTLRFDLPSGSYATVLLEQIL